MPEPKYRIHHSAGIWVVRVAEGYAGIMPTRMIALFYREGDAELFVDALVARERASKQ